MKNAVTIQFLYSFVGFTNILERGKGWEFDLLRKYATFEKNNLDSSILVATGAIQKLTDKLNYSVALQLIILFFYLCKFYFNGRERSLVE